MISPAGKLMLIVLEFYFHLCSSNLVIHVIPSVNVINQLLLEITVG